MSKPKIYTVNGFSGSIREISEHFGIKYQTLYVRLQNGMTIENAVNTEVKAVKIYTVNDFTGNLMEIANHFGIKYTTLLVRIQKGASIEEAVNSGPKMQNVNAKIYTVNGFNGNIREIANHFGIKYTTLSNRINMNGMSIQEAVDAGPKMQKGKSKIYTVNGFTGNVSQIAKHFGINYKTLCKRITQSNMSIEEAVDAGSRMQKGKSKIYTVNGFTGNIMEISEHFGISYHTLLYRLHVGMSIHDAVNQNEMRHGKTGVTYTVNGFTGNFREIADHFGINYGALMIRIYRGMSIEETVDAGPKMQNPNSKIYTVNGFTGNMSEIAKHFDINYTTLLRRLAAGFPIEEAVNKSVDKIYTVNGFTGNIREISEHFGINYSTLISRLHRGISMEEAIRKVK